MPARHDGGVPGDLDDLSPVLLAALEQTRSSACITTADLDAPGPTIVYVNAAYCAMTGRNYQDIIGRSPRVMQGALTDRAVLDRLREALESGERFSGETVNYRVDGTPFLISWSIDPVRDPDGVITHFVATQEDVTRHVRAQQLIDATQMLDRALTAVLNSTFDRNEARQALADAIVVGARKIAHAGHITVAVIDDDDTTQTSASQPGAAASAEPADRPIRFSFSQGVSQIRGYLELYGLTDAERAFLDVEGLQRYAERVGIVSGSLFEYQRQRDAAVRLQRSLLPDITITTTDFEVASAYRPGAAGLEIGGDWFDAVELDDSLIIVVGDVSGSGIDAAALMGRLRVLAAHEFARGTSVPDVLRILDGVCSGESQMATMLVAQIDTTDGATKLWATGHLPPVVFDEHTAELRYVDVAPPLGFLGSATVRSQEISMAPGTGIFLFTDGLVERRDEIITEGLDRLVASLAPASGLTKMIQHSLTAAGDQVADDVAIIAVARR